MQPTASSSRVEVVVVPRTSDLGDGFTVKRALPSAQRRLVGPFVFLDQMGPVVLQPGKGLDVRPHPHIGLATVTYLFTGEIMHRDSLGTVQAIRPGELNWMTAGRGIVHSERTPRETRQHESQLFGIQAWVALPKAFEETAPEFAHHGANALPVLTEGGAEVRLIVGELCGARSPASTLSDTLYADVRLAPGARLALPRATEERAAYVVAGTLEVEGEADRFDAGRLVVFRSGVPIVLVARESAVHLMLMGGATMDAPRHVWWNFVSSSRERIEQAKDDWRAGRFASVPEETEFIPLPDDRPPPVEYP